MRGGKVYIRGDVEYRAAIHMKEYMQQIPWLVIGGTAKDYCGEYMAGGRVIVLNLDEKKPSPVGYSLGTGIHGGAIYVRGDVRTYQLGPGAVFGDIDEYDRDLLTTVLADYGNDLNLDLSGISIYDFMKITKKGHRPFANLYTPGMNIKTQIPKHFNLTPPCMFNCPTGIPTPVFLNLIKEGKVQEAQELMDEFTPFRISVCGTVCPGPCMAACNRNLLDGNVDIRELARTYYPDFKPMVKKTRKEKISIIGAGPAGLSAAWHLSRRGYQISLYDAMTDPGGKVRKAIPRERLPDELLDKDIDRIKTLPIEFNLGVTVDGQSFQNIYKKSDVVIIATGAHITKRIPPYPGGERILSGLQFLLDINEGKQQDLSGKSVVIIGAGNVGMDIACESWRLGAKKVTAVDIQKPLAFGKELLMARERGTALLWPKFVNKLTDSRIYFTDGTWEKADVVIFSIGEKPDASFLPDSVYRDERGYITTTSKSYKSSDDKIYGCGDIVKPGLITDAIGSGRLASMEIHARLNGGEFVYPEKRLVPAERIRAEYFGGEGKEIDRCMSCGTCIYCDKCIDNCPQGAISRNGEIFTIDPVKCTFCYTCVNVCPRGAIHSELLVDILTDGGE